MYCESQFLRWYFNTNSAPQSTPTKLVFCCWHSINYSFLWTEVGKGASSSVPAEHQNYQSWFSYTTLLWKTQSTSKDLTCQKSAVSADCSLGGIWLYLILTAIQPMMFYNVTFPMLNIMAYVTLVSDKFQYPWLQQRSKIFRNFCCDMPLWHFFLSLLCVQQFLTADSQKDVL